jgi:hypothetical protein
MHACMLGLLPSTGGVSRALTETLDKDGHLLGIGHSSIAGTQTPGLDCMQTACSDSKDVVGIVNRVQGVTNLRRACSGPGAIRYFEQFPEVKPFGQRNSFHNKVLRLHSSPSSPCPCMQ